LVPFIQKTQQVIAQKLTSGEDTFLIDSMPLPICKFSRSKRLKISKNSVETSPEYGYCAA